MRAFSGVLSAAYSGNWSNTAESIDGNVPSRSAMPTSSETTLLEIERRSCNVSGPNLTSPSGVPQRSSWPVK